MRIVSWNINGIRAIDKKGALKKIIEQESSDILCLQEIKAGAEQIPEMSYMSNYLSYYNSADKAGYSGVAVYCKEKSLDVDNKIGLPEFDKEGRVLRLQFEQFTLYNFYFVNGGKSQEAFDLKLKAYDHLTAYLKKELDRGEKIVLVGDFNVAHQEIDIARPKANEKNVGFTKEERQKITNLLEAGFVDTFRVFNQEGGHYTWWRPFANARANNVGWRIDYVFVSKNLKKDLSSAFILPHIFGSDHCPAGIDISF
ncbi:MAG: exodeoxyribonuclease III [bacterium]|nr:exodeoxyribonuclease III [bacterium]